MLDVATLQTPQSARKAGRIPDLWTYVTGMKLFCLHCCDKWTLNLASPQNLGNLESGSLIPPGIWTLADVLQYGRDKSVCPYFLVRRMVSIM
jgi:DEAD_2